MKTSQIFLFALLGCTSFVFSQSYSGVLTHTNSYFTMEPFNSSYDDGSSARIFYDGNNRRIQFWNTGTTPYTHINVGDIVANGDLEATGNVTASGNLGIGVTSPTAKLHFKDSNQEIRLLTGTSSSTYRLDIGVNDDGINFENNSAVRGFIFSNINGNLLNISPNGNVGIGTTSPSNPLHITSSTENHQLRLEGINGRHAWIQYYPSGTGVVNWKNGVNGYGFNIYDMTNAAYRLTISNSGNIGIGTVNPGTWKLAVKGKIRAEEVKVETGWSDFVFEKDYDLPTLEEVEEHIQDKGHLKDIPSAEEVAENGILLGEMDSKLLQKIEELTLYTIAQEKRIKHLEKENETLKSITERVAKIEALVKTK